MAVIHFRVLFFVTLGVLLVLCFRTVLGRNSQTSSFYITFRFVVNYTLTGNSV